MLIRTLALAATLAILSTPALAHAVLLTSQPQDGAVLPVAPQTIQLTFNEPVKVTRLQLVRSDGTVIEATQTSDMMQKVDWAVPETLADGGWLLSYSVISSDTHPVSGTLRLVVGEGEPTFAEAPDESTGYTQYPRLMMLVGVLAGVGLLFAAALFRPLATRPAKAALVAAFVVATAGSAWFIYATAQEAGGSAAAFDAALAILGPGAAVFEIGLLAGVALTFLSRPRLAALCGIAALAGLGATGHAAAAPPEWLSRPVHLIHVAAVALWLGSLLVLLWRHRSSGVTAPLNGPGDEAEAGRAADLLSRFSRLAPWMVGLLVLAGSGLLILQAGNLQVLMGSRYGLVLAIKIGLVMLLLLLAAHNRWRLTRPALSQDSRAEARLRTSIRAEIVLFAAILGATALLGSAVPPRSLASSALPQCSTPGPVAQTAADIGLNIALTLESACSGRNNIAVSMAWEDDSPLVIEEVMVRFALPELNIEPFDVYLSGEDGHYSLSNYELPVPGNWRVETRIVLDAFTLRRAVFRVPLSAS